VRSLLLIHISNFNDCRLVEKEQVEGGIFGNIQIALKQKSCVLVVVDSHQ
jgi:hypothetical protein